MPANSTSTDTGSARLMTVFATASAEAVHSTDERVQGFATGLFTDPSSYTNGNTSTTDQQSQLLAESDWIRVALTGNLRDYTFMSSRYNRDRCASGLQRPACRLHEDAD